ncbi:hypothetical protein C0989_009821 [Termitomyces sp. Mn162]|nr:hypothetical protein C0989_009821 [Termitomyces sp. Mn162]
MTELWVKDKYGKARDVVLGYDDNTRLLTDPDHPVFNPIVGRAFKRELKVFVGEVTLHGGIYGWDRRNWTIVSKTQTSVTYKHIDAADEGFPGNVTAYATHTVIDGGILKTEVYATATQETPIMLTQHIYWNLDAFQDGVNDILGHHLQVDSSKVIAVDSNAIPTGDFIQVEGTPFDFTKEQEIGARWNDTVNLCGSGLSLLCLIRLCLKPLQVVKAMIMLGFTTTMKATELEVHSGAISPVSGSIYLRINQRFKCIPPLGLILLAKQFMEGLVSPMTDGLQ